MKDHYYMPNYQAMGDCRVCGHEQKKPWEKQKCQNVSQSKPPNMSQQNMI